MARITNSNAVRLGNTAPWLSTRIGSPNSLMEQLVLQYVSFFLENAFNSNETDIRYVLGSVRLFFEPHQTLLSCNVFSVHALSSDENLTDQESRIGPLVALELEIQKSISKFYSVPVRVAITAHPTNFADANFIISYFKLRILQKVPVTEIVNTLHRLLSDVPGLVGYRIDVTGRFSRQQRAGKLSVKKGLTLLSTLSSPVQYAEDFIILKHGKCGFKVWMNRTDSYGSSTLIYQT